MNSILNKDLSKKLFQRRFYILLLLFVLALFFFVLIENIPNSDIKNKYNLKIKPNSSYPFFDINKYNLNSHSGSSDYHMSNIIGEWHLQGYNNVIISIHPVREMFHSNELKITSTNISLFTLENLAMMIL